MCGIIAYRPRVPDAQLLAKLHKGLETLEYRGYDSFGVGLQANDSQAKHRYVGAPSSVTPKGDIDVPHVGIGHTRWATHGAVNEQNAHPHQVGDVLLVHNGIIENYKDIAASLHNFVPESDTDTEVVAAYINQAIQKGTTPLEAIQQFASVAAGSYALVLIILGDDNLYFACVQSPLTVGRHSDGVFVASDVMAFTRYTQTVNYLDDGDMGFTDGETISVYRIKDATPNPRRDVTLALDDVNTGKSGYAHHMLKEILLDTKGIVSAIMHQEEEVLNHIVQQIKTAEHILLIGCGTSRYMAEAGRYLFGQLVPHIGQRRMQVFSASQQDDFIESIASDTLVIALSQSGETADVISAVIKAKAKGAHCCCITNTPTSRIARLSDATLLLNVKKEVAVASTKAATAQLALLYLLALQTAGDSMHMQTLTTLSGALDALLNPRFSDHIQQIAITIAEEHNIYIIGRGIYRSIAAESALKIAEVSYMHASGLDASELKHGPLALVHDGFTVLVLGTDPTTLDNMTIAHSRGARIIGVSAQPNNLYHHWIRLPHIANEAEPFLTLIAVQLLSYHIAVLKGNNPDRPRNLAKSVTV